MGCGVGPIEKRADESMFRIVLAALSAVLCAPLAALIALIISVGRKDRYQIAAEPAAA